MKHLLLSTLLILLCVYSFGQDLTKAEKCPGDTLLLTAYSDDAALYYWYKNDKFIQSSTINTISVVDTGTYTVSACNIFGCFSDRSPAYIISKKNLFAADDTASIHATARKELHVINNDKQGCTDFDTASLRLLQYPNYGFVTLRKDGTMLYIPNKIENARDEFVYTIKDIEGNLSNPARVTVWIGNDCAVVYPNPVYNKFKINTRNEDIKKLRICDVSGRILFIDNMAVGEKEVDISFYLDGIYILQLTNDNGTALCTFKIMKK